MINRRIEVWLKEVCLLLNIFYNGTEHIDDFNYT